MNTIDRDRNHRHPDRHFDGSSAGMAVLVTILIGLIVAATTGAQGAPTRGTSRPSGQPTLSAIGQEAFAKLNANDLDGAIALLEPERAAGRATPVDLGLLGTLYLENGRPADALEVLRPMAESPAADAAVLYNAGRAALRIGDIASGERFLQQSVAQVPISPAARELGLLRGAQGRTVESFQLLWPWASRNPRDVEARLAAALNALHLERPAEAEAMLEGMPAAQPKVALLRGQLALLKRDPKAAITILEPLLERHPPEIENDLFRLTADAYLAAGQAQQAVDLLRGRQNGPRRLLLLAEALYRTGELDAAITVIEPIAKPLLDVEIAGKPPMVQGVTQYGRLLAATGRHREALPYLEKATAAEPDQALAWKNLGETKMALGRTDEAKVALDRFRTLTSQQTEARRAAEIAAQDPAAPSLITAQRAFAAGEPTKALALTRQEAAISPTDPRPRLLEIQILVATKSLTEALTVAEKTVGAFPDNPDAIYARGAVQLGLDQRVAAERDFRQALVLFPDHVAAMSDLAVLLMVKGDRPEARQLFERVLELRPDDERAASHLARLASS